GRRHAVGRRLDAVPGAGNPRLDLGRRWLPRRLPARAAGHRHHRPLPPGARPAAAARAKARERDGGDRLMPIVMTLDVMLARRKMKGKDLAEKIGISETQLSLLRSGKVKGMRFATLSKLCAVLEC